MNGLFYIVLYSMESIIRNKAVSSALSSLFLVVTIIMHILEVNMEDEGR